MLTDRLALAGRAAGVGIWDYDFTTDTLYVSEELASLYGVDPETLTWPEFVARVHPDDLVDQLARPTPSFPFGQVNEFFIRVRHRDGSYRSIRSRSTTIGEGDTPTRKLGAHIDMTDDELLVKLNNHLTEHNQRLRQFAYTASHDLRSPLRVVTQLLDLVDDHHGQEMPAAANEWLGQARDRIGRMQRLIDDLLTFAVNDAEGGELRQVDPDQIVDDAIAIVDTAGCEMVVAHGGGGPRWLAASPLEVCVRNLIDNACKHHDRLDGTVAISVSDQGSFIEIAVADDGPGIDQQQQKRIFEPFVSSDPTRSSGLGLARVRDVVEKHAGSLHLDSEPGQGSTFTLRWPVATDPGTDATSWRRSSIV